MLTYKLQAKVGSTLRIAYVLALWLSKVKAYVDSHGWDGMVRHRR